MVIISVLLLFAGCYTVLVHPEIENKDENGYTYYDDVKFYDDCSSCHKDITPNHFESPEILKSHPSYSNFGYYDFNDYYYNDSYYGNFGYYYNAPWWLEVAPQVKYKRNEEQYTGGARDNSSERSETTRDQRRDLSVPSPTVSSGSSSSSSGSSDSSTSSTSTETRSSSSSTSTDRNSNGTSGARDNSGGRSPDSGRRK